MRFDARADLQHPCTMHFSSMPRVCGKGSLHQGRMRGTALDHALPSVQGDENPPRGAPMNGTLAIFAGEGRSP
jgi:hypothetical protein